MLGDAVGEQNAVLDERGARSTGTYFIAMAARFSKRPGITSTRHIPFVRNYDVFIACFHSHLCKVSHVRENFLHGETR